MRQIDDQMMTIEPVPGYRIRRDGPSGEVLHGVLVEEINPQYAGDAVRTLEPAIERFILAKRMAGDSAMGSFSNRNTIMIRLERAAAIWIARDLLASMPHDVEIDRSCVEVVQKVILAVEEFLLSVGATIDAD